MSNIILLTLICSSLLYSLYFSFFFFSSSRLLLRDTLLSSNDVLEDPRLSLTRMIHSNTIAAFLQTQGYQIVAFDSGYRPTELVHADHYFSVPRHAVNPLEGLLMETSALPAVQALTGKLGMPTYFPGYQSHRNLVRYLLDAIPRVADLPEPKFVFAHVVIPHPPFVFTPDGEQVSQDFRFSFMDGDAYLGTKDEYRDGYRDQLVYLNKRLEGLILSILENSPQPPIIILQGDHGRAHRQVGLIRGRPRSGGDTDGFPWSC